MSSSPEDVRWLVSAAAEPWLARAALLEQDRVPLVRAVQTLRKDLSAARAHLVIEQVELRRRGAEKFPHAARMFFTRVGLEQATDAELAAYKAARFAAEEPTADVCCGIGGDLLALAARGMTCGIDRDEATAILAAANADVLQFRAKLLVAEAGTATLQDVSQWHIDPDRRASGRRTTQIEGYSPAADVLNELRDFRPDAAFKIAPGAEVESAWAGAAEREWISTRGECRQQVLWFGRLARRPGEWTATILRGPALPPRMITGTPMPLPPVRPLGEFLFEPDAAVLAAELSGMLAAEFDLAPLAAGGVFLTGARSLVDPALACFRVREVLPFDRRRLKAMLRERRIGRLEIKKRGVTETPEEIRRGLDLQGEEAAVLFVTPLAGKVAAILAERVSE